MGPLTGWASEVAVPAVIPCGECTVQGVAVVTAVPGHKRCLAIHGHLWRLFQPYRGAGSHQSPQATAAAPLEHLVDRRRGDPAPHQAAVRAQPAPTTWLWWCAAWWAVLTVQVAGGMG